MKTSARLAVLAAMLSASACTSVTPDPFAPMHPHWSEVSSRQARHSADFPGKPRQRLNESKAPGGQTASTYLRELQLGERYYGTAWTLIPNAPQAQAAKDRVLELAAAEAAKSTGGTLLAKHAVTVDGNRGLAYVVDLPKTRTRLRQQIFIVTDVLVEQTYTGPAGSETEREPGRFFDSLKLLP